MIDQFGPVAACGAVDRPVKIEPSQVVQASASSWGSLQKAPPGLPPRDSFSRIFNNFASSRDILGGEYTQPVNSGIADAQLEGGCLRDLSLGRSGEGLAALATHGERDGAAADGTAAPISKLLNRRDLLDGEFHRRGPSEFLALLQRFLGHRFLLWIASLSSLTQGGWPRPAEPPRFKVLSYRTAFFRVVVLLSFLPFLSFFAISRFLQGSELHPTWVSKSLANILQLRPKS
jgi:hypothetical protein